MKQDSAKIAQLQSFTSPHRGLSIHNGSLVHSSLPHVAIFFSLQPLFLMLVFKDFPSPFYQGIFKFSISLLPRNLILLSVLSQAHRSPFLVPVSAHALKPSYNSPEDCKRFSPLIMDFQIWMKPFQSFPLMPPP